MTLINPADHPIGTKFLLSGGNTGISQTDDVCMFKREEGPVVRINGWYYGLGDPVNMPNGDPPYGGLDIVGIVEEES